MENSFTLLDGAMGTMLQARGLKAGDAPESFNITHPEIIRELGENYINAGSDVIYANTFGANRYKLKDADIADIITRGVAAAREAARGTAARVALDVGPIGAMLEPLGGLSFDEAYDIFKEVVVAGERAGADLVVFETMSDLYEVKAAVLAAKENTNLPVWVTMTFEKNGRTFVGVTVPAMALTLSGLGVSALGFNCSLGPREVLPLVKTLSEWTDLPMILKPNAGLPDPTTGRYSLSAREFAETLAGGAQFGVTVFGGCCGTTPEFISELRRALRDKTPCARSPKIRHGVASGMKAVELSEVRTVGERINPTGKKRFQRALKENDMPYILSCAIEEEEAGADILDVNVGLPGTDEREMMKNVVRSIQSVVDLPIQIDSSDSRAIETGLRYYNGKPIVNSVNGERETLDKILPLCKKYGAAVVGLTMDKNGIPKTSEARIEIAERILEAALEYGISREDVYIDCLTLTASAEPMQARETLKAVRYVTETMGLHTTLGVSNISFGLPEREKVTAAFLAEALASGLDLPIVNPNSKAISDIISAHKVLSGDDVNCEKYIARNTGVEACERAPEKSEMTLDGAVSKGLGDECRRIVQSKLADMSEIDIVNKLLIPSLDRVGERYEKGEIFLPQLINSANAACSGFDVIKDSLAKNGGESVSRGKIIVATVKGDIHDIGKNIVKVVLENYGYTVIDLGRDVPCEKIVSAAISEKVNLVGLSALMTTTVPAMSQAVKALKSASSDIKVWVGGAVLTAEYAKEIGADFYAADAKESVDIAKKVLG